MKVSKHIVGIRTRLLALLLVVSIACRVPGQPSTLEGNQEPGQNQSSGLALVEEFGVSISGTDDERVGVVATSETGEMLVGLTGKDVIGQQKVIGAIWVGPNGETMVVYLSQKGLPEKALIGDTLFLFENYVDGVVDIAIIAPDGKYKIIRSVPFGTEAISRLSKQTVSLQGIGLLQEESIFAVMEITSTSITTAACALGFAAAVGTAGAAALPAALACSSLFLKFVSQYVEDPSIEYAGLFTDLLNIQVAGGLQMLCGTKPVECLGLALDWSVLTWEESNQFIEENPETISEVRDFLTGNSTSLSETEETISEPLIGDSEDLTTPDASASLDSISSLTPDVTCQAFGPLPRNMSCFGSGDALIDLSLGPGFKIIELYADPINRYFWVHQIIEGKNDRELVNVSSGGYFGQMPLEQIEQGWQGYMDTVEEVKTVGIRVQATGKWSLLIVPLESEGLEVYNPGDTAEGSLDQVLKLSEGVKAIRISCWAPSAGSVVAVVAYVDPIKISIGHCSGQSEIDVPEDAEMLHIISRTPYENWSWSITFLP